MAHYFWITGTGGGIGKALAEVLLQNNQNKVVGWSRKNFIHHPNFTFVPVDLSVIEDAKKIQFEQVSDAQQLTLINNAALIGDIAPVGHKSAQKIVDLLTVNTLVPILLSEQFAKTFQNHKAQKQIMNISSGAGRHPIESMSDYCASKSALDHFSSTMSLEQNRMPFPIKVISIAPGVVDTPMQDEIRLAQPELFKDHAFFVNLKSKTPTRLLMK